MNRLMEFLVNTLKALGATVAIVTLVFTAFQVYQGRIELEESRRSTEAQTNLSFYSAYQDILVNMPVELLQVEELNWDGLSEEKRKLIIISARAYYELLVFEYYMQQQSYIPSETWCGWQRIAIARFKLTPWRELWTRAKPYYEATDTKFPKSRTPLDILNSLNAGNEVVKC